MQFGTVHWRPENLQLGIQIAHNWLRKSPYALCESCRGSGDLQLCNSLLGPLLFNFLEICSVKQGHLEKFRAPGAPERRATSGARPCAATGADPTVDPHERRGPTGSTRLAQGDWTARPPPLLAIPLAPRAVRAMVRQCRPRRPPNVVAAVLRARTPPCRAHVADVSVKWRCANRLARPRIKQQASRSRVTIRAPPPAPWLPSTSSSRAACFPSRPTIQAPPPRSSEAP
jgi:hypothetical protein